VIHNTVGETLLLMPPMRVMLVTPNTSQIVPNRTNNHLAVITIAGVFLPSSIGEAFFPPGSISTINQPSFLHDNKEFKNQIPNQF
jgi:hypothetical protein